MSKKSIFILSIFLMLISLSCVNALATNKYGYSDTINLEDYVYNSYGFTEYDTYYYTNNNNGNFAYVYISDYEGKVLGDYTQFNLYLSYNSNIDVRSYGYNPSSEEWELLDSYSEIYGSDSNYYIWQYSDSYVNLKTRLSDNSIPTALKIGVCYHSHIDGKVIKLEKTAYTDLEATFTESGSISVNKSFFYSNDVDMKFTFNLNNYHSDNTYFLYIHNTSGYGHTFDLTGYAQEGEFEYIVGEEYTVGNYGYGSQTAEFKVFNKSVYKYYLINSTTFWIDTSYNWSSLVYANITTDKYLYAKYENVNILVNISNSRMDYYDYYLEIYDNLNNQIKRYNLLSDNSSINTTFFNEGIYRIQAQEEDTNIGSKYIKIKGDIQTSGDIEFTKDVYFAPEYVNISYKMNYGRGILVLTDDEGIEYLREPLGEYSDTQYFIFYPPYALYERAIYATLYDMNGVELDNTYCLFSGGYENYLLISPYEGNLNTKFVIRTGGIGLLRIYNPNDEELVNTTKLNKGASYTYFVPCNYGNEVGNYRISYMNESNYFISNKTISVINSSVYIQTDKPIYYLDTDDEIIINTQLNFNNNSHYNIKLFAPNEYINIELFITGSGIQEQEFTYSIIEWDNNYCGKHTLYLTNQDGDIIDNVEFEVKEHKPQFTGTDAFDALNNFLGNMGIISSSSKILFAFIIISILGILGAYYANGNIALVLIIFSTLIFSFIGYLPIGIGIIMVILVGLVFAGALSKVIGD